jgi:hypothetical protein
MDKQIKSYIQGIIEELHCSEEEKREIAEEMKDHLNLLKKELWKKGFLKAKLSKKRLEVLVTVNKSGLV